ncbi:hypothetical protein D3C85_1474590 [compost metagenome]
MCPDCAAFSRKSRSLLSSLDSAAIGAAGVLGVVEAAGAPGVAGVVGAVCCATAKLPAPSTDTASRAAVRVRVFMYVSQGWRGAPLIRRG